MSQESRRPHDCDVTAVDALAARIAGQEAEQATQDLVERLSW